MRQLVVICLTCGMALTAADFVVAQESLCNPCIDAPIRAPRQEFRSPNAARIVTADDMRKLGIISVADMVNQLPNDVAATADQAPAEPEAEAPVAGPPATETPAAAED